MASDPAVGRPGGRPGAAPRRDRDGAARGSPDPGGLHVDPAAATLLVQAADGSVLAVGCLYDEPEGLLLSGGATGGARSAGAAAGALLDAAAARAATLGRELLVEADDAAGEMVDQLAARGAAVVDEVHIVAEV